MLWLYRILYLPALVLGAPFYLWRMRKRGGYRENFGQRFGRVAALPPKPPGVKRIWLQAVSVGEMLAIGPLLAAWQRQGGVEVYLTTTTSTGYQLAKERYRDATIGIGYFPLDWAPFSARAWRAVQPDLALLTEGERWPEHIHQAVRRSVPIVCVNARMSDRSFRRMARFKAAVQPLLGGITRLLACSEHDAERFRALGFPAERITTTGSIKLDVTIPALSADEKAQLRHDLGLPDEGLIIMGASTWEGEEAAMVKALQTARAAGHTCSLLLVPRHAERRGAIELLLRGRGVSFHFRSRGSAKATVDVAVGDTTGEMRKFLQLADVVFVGKSLPPHTEGQTPVESAILGRPLLFGPGMGNFRLIARELTAGGAAQLVPDAAALIERVTALLGDPAQRDAMSAAGQTWHQANVGAVERTLAALQDSGLVQ
ncbi:MAG: 3-deoxy-D-manno-octulosonic acid transferase [Opitutaceae bacterium]|nr:3-deoxy-D-manno-octulosonic acid transferase [Cephaloticoccus sp.]MCP5530118.1 3-deoxy-D-manno-octulosonic acid transferase [Opitutaceae bacterium]